MTSVLKRSATTLRRCDPERSVLLAAAVRVSTCRLGPEARDTAGQEAARDYAQEVKHGGR